MLDLTGDNEFTALCADWLEAKKQLAKWQAVEKETKVAIINRANKNQAHEVLAGNFEVTVRFSAGSEGRVIGLNDVGQVIGARKGSTTIKINEIER